MSTDPIASIRGNASLDPLADTSIFSLYGIQTLSQILSSMLSSQNSAITQLRDSRSALNSIRGTFSQIGSLAGALRNEAATLALPTSSSRSIFRTTGFTSTDSSKVRALSSTTSATPGTHYVNVYQLAQPHTVLSETFNPNGNDLMNFLARGTYRFRIAVTGEAGTTVTADETADVTFVIGKSDEVVSAAGGTKANSDNEYGLVISEGGSIPAEGTILSALAAAFNRSTLGPTTSTTIATGTAGKGRLQADVAGGALTIRNTIATGNPVTLSELQHDLLTNLSQSATSQSISGNSSLVSSVGTRKYSSTSDIALNPLLAKPFTTTIAGANSTFTYIPKTANNTILSDLAAFYDAVGSVTDPNQAININAYVDTSGRLVIANGSSQDIAISDPDGLLAGIFGAVPGTLTTPVSAAATSAVTSADSTTNIAGILTGLWQFSIVESETGLSVGVTRTSAMKSINTTNTTSNKSVSITNSSAAKSVSITDSSAAKSVSITDSSAAKSVSITDSSAAKSVTITDSSAAKSVTATNTTSNKSLTVANSTSNRTTADITGMTDQAALGAVANEFTAAGLSATVNNLGGGNYSLSVQNPSGVNVALLENGLGLFGGGGGALGLDTTTIAPGASATSASFTGAATTISDSFPGARTFTVRTAASNDKVLGDLAGLITGASVTGAAGARTLQISNSSATTVQAITGDASGLLVGNGSGVDLSNTGVATPSGSANQTISGLTSFTASGADLALAFGGPGAVNFDVTTRTSNEKILQDLAAQIGATASVTGATSARTLTLASSSASSVLSVASDLAGILVGNGSGVNLGNSGTLTQTGTANDTITGGTTFQQNGTELAQTFSGASTFSILTRTSNEKVLQDLATQIGATASVTGATNARTLTLDSNSASNVLSVTGDAAGILTGNASGVDLGNSGTLTQIGTANDTIAGGTTFDEAGTDLAQAFGGTRTFSILTRTSNEKVLQDLATQIGATASVTGAANARTLTLSSNSASNVLSVTNDAAGVLVGNALGANLGNSGVLTQTGTANDSIAGGTTFNEAGTDLAQAFGGTRTFSILTRTSNEKVLQDLATQIGATASVTGAANARTLTLSSNSASNVLSVASDAAGVLIGNASGVDLGNSGVLTQTGTANDAIAGGTTFDEAGTDLAQTFGGTKTFSILTRTSNEKVLQDLATQIGATASVTGATNARTLTLSSNSASNVLSVTGDAAGVLVGNALGANLGNSGILTQTGTANDSIAGGTTFNEAGTDLAQAFGGTRTFSILTRASNEKVLDDIAAQIGPTASVIGASSARTLQVANADPSNVMSVTSDVPGLVVGNAAGVNLGNSGIATQLGTANDTIAGATTFDEAGTNLADTFGGTRTFSLVTLTSNEKVLQDLAGQIGAMASVVGPSTARALQVSNPSATNVRSVTDDAGLLVGNVAGVNLGNSGNASPSGTANATITGSTTFDQSGTNLASTFTGNRTFVLWDRSSNKTVLEGIEAAVDGAAIAGLSADLTPNAAAPTNVRVTNATGTEVQFTSDTNGIFSTLGGLNAALPAGSTTGTTALDPTGTDLADALMDGSSPFNITGTKSNVTADFRAPADRLNQTALSLFASAINGAGVNGLSAGTAGGTQMSVTNATGATTVSFPGISQTGGLSSYRTPFQATGMGDSNLGAGTTTATGVFAAADTELLGSIGPVAAPESITISGLDNESGGPFSVTPSGIPISSGDTDATLLSRLSSAIVSNGTLNTLEVAAKNVAGGALGIANGTGANILVTDSVNDILQDLGFGTGGAAMAIASTEGTNHIRGRADRLSDGGYTVALDPNVLDRFRYLVTGSLGGSAEVIIGATDSDLTALGNIRDAINGTGGANPRVTVNGPLSTITGTITTDNRLRITSSSTVSIQDQDSAGDPSTDTGVDNLVRVLNFDAPSALSGEVSLVGEISTNSSAGATLIPYLALGDYPFVMELNDSNTSSTGDTIAAGGTVSILASDTTNSAILSKIASSINSAMPPTTSVSAIGAGGQSVATVDRATASVITESANVVRLSVSSNSTGPMYQIRSIIGGQVSSGATRTITPTTVSTDPGSGITQRLFETTVTPSTATHLNTTDSQYVSGSAATGTIGNTPVDASNYQAYGALATFVGVTSDAEKEKGLLLLPLDKQQKSGAAGYTKRGSELYSVFSLDSSVLLRDSNQVNDALTGATFELANSTLNASQQASFLAGLNPTSTSTAITPRPSEITTATVNLVIGQNSSDVSASIGKFIDSYNGLVQFLMDNQRLDTSTPASPVRGKLAGDAAYSNLQRRLTEIVFSTVTPLKTYTDSGELSGGLEGDPTRLQDIGITVDADGKLQLSTTPRIVTPARVTNGTIETTTDSATFDSKLESNLAGVTHLFNFDGKDSTGSVIEGAVKGIAVQAEQLLDGFAKGGGIVDISRQSLDSRIARADAQIGFVLGLISSRQDSVLEELARIQDALSAVSAQKSYLQSFLVIGFHQSVVLGSWIS